MLQPKYLARKVTWLLVTFFIVATFNFLLFHVMPGNPVLLLARSGHLTQQEAAQVTKLYGLDHSLFAQYFIYLNNLLHGQLGISYAYHEPVSQLLGQYLGNTVLLLFAATLITIVFGTIVGVIAANRRGGKYDATTVVASVIGWSLPTFWVGIILVFICGVWIHVFPIVGMETPNEVYTSWLQRVGDISSHLVLPTFTLVVVNLARIHARCSGFGDRRALRGLHVDRRREGAPAGAHLVASRRSQQPASHHHLDGVADRARRRGSHPSGGRVLLARYGPFDI